MSLPIVISPSTFADVATCAHRVALDARGPQEEKREQDPLMRLLWEGTDVPVDTPAPRHPDGAWIIDAAGQPDARAAETSRAMRAGASVIVGGFIHAQDLEAEVDLLERSDVPSDLGAWSYVPIELRPEVNAANVPDVALRPVAVRTTVRLCLIADLLERTQGVRPEHASLRPGSGPDRVIDLAEAWPAYEAMIERIRRIRRGEEATEPGLISACKLCPWQSYCVRELEAADDLTLVSTLGPSQRKTLRTLGIRSVAELATAEPSRIVSVHPALEDRAEKWVRQARVRVTGTPEVLVPWHPPDADLEISYDVEDDGGASVYLHGFLLRERGSREVRSVSLFAEPKEGEADIWSQFLAFVRTLPESYVVYTYTDYEMRHIQRMAATYGGAAEVADFLGRTCDVFAALKQSVVLPTRTYTLKAVARYLGFAWRDADPGGAQSIAWWRAYRADPVANADLRKRLIEYNEDDCRATFVVRDWLEREGKDAGDLPNDNK